MFTTTLPDPDGAGALAAETLTTTYNARGLAETVYGIDTYVSDFDYEANGALDRQTLGSGVIINNTYDPLTNRLTSLFAARPAYLALLDFDYTYDDGGNITVIEDEVRDEAWSYEYDALDRLTYAGLSDVNGLLLERQSFTYDTLGNILTTSTQLPAASVSYGAFMVAGAGSSANYGSRAALNSLTGHGLASESYETSSVRTAITGLPSGGSSPGGPGYTRGSFASGAQGESASYQGAAGFNPLSGMGVGDETSGMGITAFVRRMVEGFGGYQPPEPYTGPTGAEQQTYTYAEDGAGPHAVSSLSDGSTFTYDANGNMVTRYQEGVSWTYTFDDENRLIATSDGTTTTTTLYDHSGTRVKRTVDDGTTVTETIYVMGMEITRVDEAETERTIYYGAGGAFRVIEAGDTSYTQTDLYYRLTDHLGSTSLITDEDGLKIEGSEALYGPFGELRQEPTTTLTDFGYTGQRLDGSTGGLMYYGARYYLPELKRFISADSIIPRTFNSQALNRYAYVINNPLNYSDPSGHGMYSGDDYDPANWSSPGHVFLALPQYDNNYFDNDPQYYDGYLESQLDSFGITVDFDDGISFTKKLLSKKVILEGVSALANGAMQLFHGQSLQGAYLSVFGQATEIFVENSSELSLNGKTVFGKNTSSNTTGPFQIHLALIPLLASPNNGYTNVPLVAHEIAHNITWSMYYQGVGEEYADDANIANNFINRAGDYAWGRSLDTRPDYWRSELTADIIVNWAFNSFQNDDTGKGRILVRMFILEKMSLFSSSVQCQQSGVCP